VQLEGLGKLKKKKPHRTQTRDLPACSIVPPPTTVGQLYFLTSRTESDTHSVLRTSTLLSASHSVQMNTALLNQLVQQTGVNQTVIRKKGYGQHQPGPYHKRRLQEEGSGCGQAGALGGPGPHRLTSASCPLSPAKPQQCKLLWPGKQTGLEFLTAVARSVLSSGIYRRVVRW
jgi:hypothetical protein